MFQSEIFSEIQAKPEKKRGFLIFFWIFLYSALELMLHVCLFSKDEK